MEVIVLLEDRKALELTQELSKRLDQSSRGAREGAVNPDAPACNTQFDKTKYGEPLSPSNCSNLTPNTIGFILPHELLKGTRLRKK